MKVVEKTGDLFKSGEPAIGHGVNCVGVMNAGIAAGFSQRWPKMAETYQRVCFNGHLKPGEIWVWIADDDQLIFNIASQKFPGADAKLDYIAEGMEKVSVLASEFYNIHRVGIPRIGCGIGGLKWRDVKEAIRGCGRSRFTAVVYSLEEE